MEAGGAGPFDELQKEGCNPMMLSLLILYLLSQSLITFGTWEYWNSFGEPDSNVALGLLLLAMWPIVLAVLIKDVIVGIEEEDDSIGY